MVELLASPPLATAVFYHRFACSLRPFQGEVSGVRRYSPIFAIFCRLAPVVLFKSNSVHCYPMAFFVEVLLNYSKMVFGKKEI
jgi:hypothetical protein